MARIVLSALVSDIRGKMAGSVVQGGHYGLIIKGNKWRCNSAYKGIQDWKIKTGNVFHLWKRLTADQKASWKIAAVAAPVTRPNGSVYTLTGYMFFTQTNLPLAYQDQPLKEVPGNPPANVFEALDSIDVDYSAPDDWNATFNLTIINEPENPFFQVDFFEALPVGSPRPPGIGGGGDFKFGLQTLYKIGSVYAGNFGDLPPDSVVYGRFLVGNGDEPSQQQNINWSFTN